MRYYDSTSHSALQSWLYQNSGEIISNRQAAFVTGDPSYTRRFYRQHVFAVEGGIVIENALTHCGSPAYKVYWNVLYPTSFGIEVETPDRRKAGHWVGDGHSVPWLVTSSVSSL